MKTFTLDNDNNISAFATAAEAAAATPTPFDSFASEKEFAELVAGFPAERWRGLWNCLPGVTPVRGFRSPQAAASRIWARIQRLGDAAQPAAEQRAKPRIEKKAKGRAHSAKGAPSKAGSAQKSPAAKAAPKGKKAASRGKKAAPASSPPACVQAAKSPRSSIIVAPLFRWSISVAGVRAML